MEELALFARLVVATLFVTAVVSKLKDLGKHRVMVEQYEMLPRAVAPVFAVAEVAAEAVAALLLFAGVWLEAAYVLSGLLLLAYTIAIGVNLLRGRREISCGCGGAAGDHQLSWWLVTRNAVLLAMLVGAAAWTGAWGTLQAVWMDGMPVSQVFDFVFWLTVFASYTVFFWLIGMQELILLRNRANLMLEQE